MRKTLLVLACVLLSPNGAGAGDGSKHVVELFTSQGCYSCPPADRLLGDLIDSRADLVALEFHVDYWNDLVYGLAGRWEDPFSDRAHTRRQQRYRARGLDGNNGVYTPQAVVDGRAAVVGSNKRGLKELLKREAPMTAQVTVTRDGGSMRVSVTGEHAGTAEVWLYRFDVRQVTLVEAGENKGKTLTNHHVVRESRRLGEWSGRRRDYVVDDLRLGENQGCAVVVQQPDQGAVLGAGLCS